MNRFTYHCNISNKHSGSFILFTSILFIFLFINASLSAQSSASFVRHPGNKLEYEIARWFGFKRAALSITFDDNYRLQFTRALSILNEHNYKATYFIVTNRIGKGFAPGWDTLTILALQGHEIASHSVNHANFVNLSLNPDFADSMRKELENSRNTINAHVLFQQCETFAWPFGAVNVKAIGVAKKFYMACRGSSNSNEGKFPENIYNIYSQHIYHDTPLAMVNFFLTINLKQKGWLIERWHGFRVGNDTNGYEPVPIEIFQAHLNYTSLQNDSLWVSPLNNVVKYIQERQNSTLKIVDTTTSCITMSLTNNLPDTLFHYNFPLSIKVRVDGRLNHLMWISQNNHPLPMIMKSIHGNFYVCFDAIPNSGLIYFWLSTFETIPVTPSGSDYLRKYSTPITTSMTLFFDLPETELIHIQIYNMQGMLIRNISRNYASGRHKVIIDRSGMQPGVYLCLLETREKRVVLRMILTS